MNIIEIENLTYSYPASPSPILKNISLQVEEGDFLAIVGNNGCGKSTFCKTLNGLIPHFIAGEFEGTVKVGGLNTLESDVGTLACKAGYVYQDFENQIVRPTVLDDASYACLNYAMEDYKERGREALSLCGLEGREEDYIWQLSGGQTHLRALAGAVSLRPDILILDGISSETYAEQGMLEDLSGILKEAGLLDNIESAYTKEDGSIYEMPVKFGIPMIEGNKEDVQAVTDLASLADVLTKHKDEYGLTSESIYKLPLLYSMYPQALLEKLADNSSAAWMKKDGTLDEEKIKVFLEQSERIYQAGKDAMDELKAAYPQAFDDSGQPVYERAGSISGETAVLLSHNCIFALGDIFSPLDFAFVNSMAEIDTSLAYALWNGQIANCFIPVSRIGISSRASQKAAAEKFVEYLFSEEGQMLSREDGFPVVEAVYNGEDYWNQGEAGNVLVTGGSSNSENGQELVYSIKVPSADKVNELKQLGKMLTTPVLDNTIITSAVCENGVRYLNGEISLDEAANAVMQQVNLYLAE